MSDSQRYPIKLCRISDQICNIYIFMWLIYYYRTMENSTLKRRFSTLLTRLKFQGHTVIWFEHTLNYSENTFYNSLKMGLREIAMSYTFDLDQNYGLEIWLCTKIITPKLCSQGFFYGKSKLQGSVFIFLLNSLF